MPQEGTQSGCLNCERLTAERERLKEEVLQIGEQMAKRHEENKRLEVELEEARKAFKLLQERCKEGE